MAYKRHYIGDFERCRKDHPSWPVVHSEGDSWFSYANVIGKLDQVGGSQRAWSLLRLEKAGDEIMTIMSGGQRSKLRKRLLRWKLDALLFSAGGNDIVGPDLLPLLRPFQWGMSPQDVVAFSRYERRVRQIQDCYRELLDMMSDAGQQAKVFANSYDYAIPSNKPVKLLGVKVAGPWMAPYFKQRSIPQAIQQEVIRFLIDAWSMRSMWWLLSPAALVDWFVLKPEILWNPVTGKTRFTQARVGRRRWLGSLSRR